MPSRYRHSWGMWINRVDLVASSATRKEIGRGSLLASGIYMIFCAEEALMGLLDADISPVKRATLLKRRGVVTIEHFRDHWAGPHAKIAETIPGGNKVYPKPDRSEIVGSGIYWFGV